MEDKLKRKQKSLTDVIGKMAVKKVKRENATHWRPCRDNSKIIANVTLDKVYRLLVDVEKTGHWIIDDNGELYKIPQSDIGEFVCFEADQSKLEKKNFQIQTLFDSKTEESNEVINEKDKLYDLLRSELKGAKYSLRFVELIIKARRYGLTTQEELEMKEKCQKTIEFMDWDFKQNRTISLDSLMRQSKD